MARWDKYPFLKLLPFFIAGILLGFYNRSVFVEYLSILFGLLAVTIILLALLYKRLRQQAVYPVSIAMLLLGLVVILTKYDASSPVHYSHTLSAGNSYVVVISGDVKENQFNYSAVAEVVGAGDVENNNWQPSDGNIYLVIGKQAVDSIPHQGMRFIIHSSLVEPIRVPLNPVKFNFQKYAASQNVFYQAYLKKGTTHKWYPAGQVTPNTLSQMVSRLNGYISINIHHYFKEDAGLMLALLLGNRDRITPDMKDNFIGLGVIHVLAVSGLHVGILFLVLTYLLSALKQLPKGYIWQPAVIILCLWFYALLTGFSPSVVRAVTMFSFIAIGKIIYRNPNVYNALLVSAFVLLMFNPFMLFQLGFQLSYLAVWGIVFFYPKINSWVQPKYKVIQYIWSLLAVSLSAQLATFPLTIATFHLFPTYFLIGNLLILPLVTLLLSGGVVFIALSFIPIIAGGLAKGLSLIINGIAWLSDVMNNNLPHSPWQQLYPNEWVLWLLLLSVGLLIYFITYKKRVYLKYSLLVLMVSLLVNVFHYYQMNTRQKLVVLADKNTTPVLLINGRSVQVLNNSLKGSMSNALDDLADLWKLEYKEEWASLNNQPPIYQWGDKTFVMIDKALVLKDVKDPLPVDYLIVCEETDFKVEEILADFKPKQVVLGQKIRKESKKQWQQTSINVYDIDEKGYFEATI